MTDQQRIIFKFYDETPEVKEFVYNELAKIQPHFSKLIKSLYELNWSKDYDETEWMEVIINIPFRSGMPTKGPYARVFEFVCYTDSEDTFDLYVSEAFPEKHGRKSGLVADTKLIKFSEWIEVCPS